MKFWKVLLFLWLICVSDIAWGKAKVFILSSYHKGDICGERQYRGVLKALEEDLYGRYILREFWLDSRHLHGEDFSARVSEAVKRIESFAPDILITIDDPAFKVALDHYLGRKKPLIVFSGVNRPLQEYNRHYKFLSGNFPVKNVTGVYENLFAKEAIQFLESWLQNRHFKIAVLFSTDMIGVILKTQVEMELKNTSYFQRLVFKRIGTLQELEKALREIKEDPKIKAYFPFVMSVMDNRSGRYYSFTELVPLLKKTLRIPEIFPNNMGAAKLGLLGGVGTDFFRMGYQAGRMAVRLLQGYPIEKVPVEWARSYTIVINISRARECNLPIRDDILNMADFIVGF